MLFVGFGLTDPNFCSIVDSVQRALGSSGRRGTVLTLSHEPVKFELWDDDLADATGEPLATMDTRLDGEEGTMELMLPGRIGFKDVKVSFSYHTSAA